MSAENSTKPCHQELPKDHKDISKFQKALPQILAIAVKNFLLFGLGMTLGFPTILIPKLSDGGDASGSIVLDQEAISWIGSLNYLCVSLGCILSGFVTRPFGRRRSMQIVNVPFLAAWLLFHFATERWHLFLALCLTGTAGGLLEAPTLTYLSEVTTPDLRGALASSTSVAVICGHLLVIVMGSIAHWRTVAMFSCISPILSVILLFFVPESPHWLIYKDRLEDAQKSLAWLKGWVPVEDAKSDLEDLRHQIKSTARNDDTSSNRMEKLKKTLALYTKKDFLWPFGLVSLVFFLLHFSGTTTLLTYAVNIFETLGSPVNKYNATIILGLTQVIGCILSSSLVHFTGKRKVNFCSLIGCGICFAVVATYAFQLDITYLVTGVTDNTAETKKSWIPMTFLIGSALFASVGIRILPWMLIGEVFHHEIRGPSSGFSSAVSYIFAFFANKTFFSLINLLTLSGTLWLYSAISIVGFIMLYFWLPETEGKTLFEVSQHFAGEEKLSNKLKAKKCEKNKDVTGSVNEAFEEVSKNKLDISIQM